MPEDRVFRNGICPGYAYFRKACGKECICLRHIFEDICPGCSYFRKGERLTGDMRDRASAGDSGIGVRNEPARQRLTRITTERDKTYRPASTPPEERRTASGMTGRVAA